LSDHRAQAITDYIDDRLLPRLRPHALALTDAFEFADEHLRAEIATGTERARQDEARDYYAEQRASGYAPVDEKDLVAGRKARR
jgi:acyl-CoA oxidase